MLVISIDGASRRNGQPSCVAAGGAFIQEVNNVEGELYTSRSHTCTNWEKASTSQRGELLALVCALEYIIKDPQEADIITDSEYIFNAMTKQWYTNWIRKGWVTASGAPVKNKDKWQEIAQLVERLPVDASFVHIKGHCIPFGKVTARKALIEDSTGHKLQCLVEQQFDKLAPAKLNVFVNAQALSERNNGFKLPMDLFRHFVVGNTVADALATSTVELADRES